MRVIESIVTDLLAEIDRIVDRKVEEKVPEMIRAVGLSKRGRGRKSSRRLIPSVRISRRCLKFDLGQLRRVIQRGGNAKPYRFDE